MKIFKVERTDGWSYDDYDSFICFANSEDEAKRISPDEFHEYKGDEWHFKYHDGTTKVVNNYHNWTDIVNLKVTELDPAKAVPGLILASYNAG